MSEPTRPGPDHTVVTTQRRRLLSGYKRGERFDDHIDTGPEISNADAVRIVWRAVKLLVHAKGLFATKFLMSTAIWIPGLFLGWFGKIIMDHVINGRELDADEALFPPHMKPILRFLEGREPMEIMLLVSGMFVVGLLLIGTRGGGTGAGVHGGRDAASHAENAISSGGSRAGSIWGLAEWWVNVRMNQRVANALRTRLFNRLTRVPMTAVDDQRVGDQIYRVIYDSSEVPEIVYQATFEPFFVLLGYLITMYQLETYANVAPELIWLAWVMFPVVLFSTLPMTRVIRRANHNNRAAGAATTNAMEETMNNIGAVQSLGGARQETRKFAERSAQQFWRERLAMVIGVALIFFISLFGEAIGLITGYITSGFAITGQLTAGDFFALMGLYESVRGAAGDFGGLWVKLQGAVASLRRVFFFVDYGTEDDTDGERQLTALGEGVKFDGVDFVYPDGRQALRDINLELGAGELVAFVGPTGAGKTSLAYMIPAFLRATRGRVSIDGVEVGDYALDSLRREVTYVFQEHQLLAESVRDNIRFAKPDATDDEVHAALAAAGCTEFVASLPEGIDTVLGRSGDTLSVGQQQRLSIARGLVRDSKILILDEPTAALDPRTENALVRALHTASAERLVIVIAHRLSTIRQASRIVFVEDGEIRDVGDHDSLMADPNGSYRRYVELQTA
ncbi:MAG: ABC transporter ATP-binding protein [Pseudomonadales bacterium]|nr:ABC transporter ATP-binding protein [Pseudomonadales bacterium]